ncbi:NAD(P)-dependent oxidoreductase [Veillonella intestinalis]|uniref:NAD(P)-dependent oxidoreductase n=1 Tax=Veillonella intestinalis TaxID=2941341 RepID=UPI00203DE9A6|nr:NAD(P)-dependent oxidoreductase [Veillonella intestinalis]
MVGLDASEQAKQIAKAGYTEDRDYTLEEALAEAKRCLNCAKPLCRTGCPIENEIPRFIQAIARGNFGEANDIIGERSNLPAVCGRVCPREKQCEGHCILNRANKPINIGKLERFAADFESLHGLRRMKPIIKDQGKIGIIGSGPAGLTVASDMAKLGYEVTIFEKQDEPGGILLYGIPAFRLSKEVVHREINRLKALGVTFECNTIIGPEKTIDSLFEDGYDAIFIATGTHVPMELPMRGDEKSGVLQAMALLTAVQLHQNGRVGDDAIPVNSGDRVVVIGAGNVAMDAARTCVRLGASVTVAYRRGEENMSANPLEYKEAKEEGVAFKFYASPASVEGEVVVEGLRCEIQEPQEDGSVTPTGHYETIPADKIIIAIGHKPNARLVGPGNGIEVNKDGYVVTREMPYGMTSRKGVFAGGDVVHKPATVVLAMRAAKKVVEGMVNYCEAKRFLGDM